MGEGAGVRPSTRVHEGPCYTPRRQEGGHSPRIGCDLASDAATAPLRRMPHPVRASHVDGVTRLDSCSVEHLLPQHQNQQRS